MIKKEILIICLIMCFICSLSAVSAADDAVNGTDNTVLAISETDDIVEQSNDLSSYSLPENTTVLKAGSEEEGSFSDLNTAINGDDTVTVITLDKNYTFDSSTDNDFVSGIVISRSVEIIGNGFTINGNNQARIFDISGESAVTLNGITFINGNSGNLNGGAIYSSGTVNIEDCKFINNTADCGGALYISGSDTTTITNCRFEYNSAAADGGAILWAGSNDVISNCTFICNDASNDGGAIYLEGSGDSDCINTAFDSCKFYNNTAGMNGGAINWHEGAQDGKILNSIFENNIANSNGGAIYWDGHNGQILHSNFTNNYAKGSITDAHGNYGEGGAIMWSGDDGIIGNCTFTKNNGKVNGGAIFIHGSADGICNNVTIDSSSFVYNTAESNDGGAIYVEGDNCNIKDSTFINNTAGDDGGAIYWYGDSGNIDNITAHNNRGISLGSSHSKGGTIIVTGSDMTINEAKINAGFAEVVGGGMFITGNDVTITNSKLTNCYVTTEDGGALNIIGNNTHIINTTIENSTAVHGGGIYWEGNDGYVDNIIVIGNNATEDGAGMTILGERCEIFNSTFMDNTAGDDGGAIQWSGNNGRLYNSNFVNNGGISDQRGSSSRGGAIALTGSNVTIDKSNFTQCYIIYTAANADLNRLDGGALFITGNNVTVLNSIFNECNATHAGGAIYVIGNSTTIDGCDFNDNYVARKGGGAIFVEGTKGKVLNSNFTGNIVNSTLTSKDTYGGGAIFWTGGKSGDTIKGCIFTNNTAHISFSESGETSGGGAIFWARGGSGGDIEDCEFYNNSIVSKTDALGGAINWDRSINGVINNCTFVDNYATTLSANNQWVQGGALYWRSLNGKVSNSKFINCWSDNEAGAIYWSAQRADGSYDYESDGYIIGCTFENNYDKSIAASNNYKSGGGAVLVKESVNVYFINSTFTNNTSLRQGGAISVGSNAQNVNCDGCVFINNSCPDTGGALYWSDGYIYNSKFINNTVHKTGNTKYGGAVYSTKPGVVIFNSSFENNTIPFGRGGAVYLTGNNANITNSTFKYNSISGLQGKEALGGAVWLSGADDVVDDCTFIGNTINGTGQWLQGGALAVNAARPVINNSYFADNYCEHEGGALYLQGNGGTIENCTFESNTANGSQYAEGYYGGGAIYAKAVTNSKVINSNIINNTALTGGGVFIYSGSITFTNCSIEDNNAETGAGAYNHQGTATFKDSEFNNNIASDKGGGIYYKSGTTFNNATFNKNNATYGGAIYADSGRTIDKIYAYDNVAEQGGAIYLATGGSTVQNSILKFNKADYGSAIYSAVSGNDQNIYNVVILDNQALAVQFSEIHGTVTGDTLEYSVLFEGGDNILNGIYDAYSRVYVRNVTYWGVSDGVGTVLNSGSNRINPSKTNPTSGSTGLYETQREAGINITFTLYDENNNVKYNLVGVTDIAGNVTFIVTDANVASYDIRITHFEDSYYTELSYATKNLTKVKVDAHDVYYGHIEFANVTVTPANSTVTVIPSGEIIVYIDGEEYGNFTLDENGKYALNIAKLTVGNHTLKVQYKGDAYFLPENGETTFEVLPVPYELIINVTDYYYGNVGKGTVTVPDYVTGLVNITIGNQTFNVDVTRDKTVEFEFQILNVGNYTIYGSYSETDTYFGFSNSTDFNVLKVNSTITIEVNYGKVTEIIVTVGDYNCTGNVTITVDGDEMNFTLENGQAIRQVTKLASGNHTINATYYGDHNHYGSYNDIVYEVIKLDTPIEIDVHNMTYGENQTMIIRLPTDITGENITVTFNGETKNYTLNRGKVTIPIEGLVPGEYPISVSYEGNPFYLENSTDTSFWVNKATPEMDVEVENIIYNATEEHIAVNINQTGNVTIRVIDENNNSWFIENPEIIIVDNQVTWNISNLPGGDYIAEVTYHGNQNYTSLTVNKTFTVEKAPSDLTINITNAYVGETTVINVTVSPDKVTGNVSVYIDGIEYIRELDENGTVLIEMNNFTHGNHSVVAVYDGDRNYSSSRNNTPFMVEYNPNGIFIVIAQNITVGENETISVIVPDDAQGIVLIDVGGVGYYINLTAGQRNITVPNLEKGVYDVNGTWINDPKYGPLENITDFTVIKNNMTIGLEVEDIDYGQTEVINVTVGDATGNVTIKVNDTIFKDVPIVNGVATVSVSDLPAGYYVVNVTYNGDKKYNVNGTTGSFNVRQIPIPIEIVPQNITFGEKEIIKVYVDAEGNVTVTVDGQVFEEVALVNGVATVEVDGYLLVDNYTVEATYNGNANYTANATTADFTVQKANVTLVIDVQDIPYGDVEHVIVTVRAIGDAQGNVTITVAGNTTTIVLGQEQTWVLRASVGSLDDYEGQATWHIYNLPVGTYPVTATYNGNENFNPLTIEDSFIVYQIDPQLDVEVDDIYVWDTEVVNITLHENATGEVLVYVDANTTPIHASIVNGTAQVNLTGLSKGTHSIWVFYDGDLNFTADRVMKAFEVKLRTPTITVNATNITAGDVEVINVTIPANATGYVVITGNCTDNPIYIDTFVNGNATINIEDLPVGNYTVHAMYYGDGNYTGAEAETTFEVRKANVEMAISVESIDYGQAANITVTITPDATGNITIKINDTHEITLPIANGKVNWIVEGLAADNYTVYANYSGDAKYNENNTNINDSFEVRQISPELEIVSVVSTADENATIVVKVDPRVTDNVTIVVNEKPYTKEVGEDGIVVFTTDVLDYGDYTIYASYPGDKNFTEDSDTLDFTTNQTDDYLINITAADISVGDNTNITVRVPADATGNVIIELNETNYTCPIRDGVAVLDSITTLKEGVYNVTAYFGNDKYVNKTVSTRFVVSKVDSPIKVDVENIYVGDNAYINVTVPDGDEGTVTIEINGVSYSPESVTDGVARFVVPDLAYGNKTVAVTYSGTDKYVTNFTTANFTVDKRKSTVAVTVEPIDVGEDAVITVTVPQNATGWVIVEIDNQTYAINVNGGTGSTTVKGLASGDYPINVTYLGDDQYFNSTNATSLKVSKVPSSINVTVENITVGENAVINIEVPEDVCGNVTVTVDDENYTVPVSGGHGTLVLPDLEVGDHKVNVTFEGCKKYEPSQNSTTFTVSKVNTTDIKVIDQGNGTVVVVVPDDATGTVEIKVGDHVYNSTVEDGIAVIDLVNETPGTYDLEVTYSGDENHTAANTTGTATIPKLATPISVEVDNINVGDTAVITVNVPDDAKGNVTIEIDGVKYTEEIKNGKAVFNVANLTAGNKTIAVDYVGDNNYTGNHTTSKITVSKCESTVSATITNSSVGENVTVTVTVPKDATGQVLIDIGGVGYYVNVTDGTGTIEIPRMPSGNYNATVTYLGDDKYLPSSNTATFNVTKVESFVIPEAQNIYVGDNEVITLTVPEDATGTVTIVIDGEEYIFNMDDGTLGLPSDPDKVFPVAVSGGNGKLVISGLPKGDYVVSARYNGDDKYMPSTNKTTFKVLRKSSTMDVTDLGNGTVVVDLPDDATGTVEIKVGNNTYNATVENGKAVIDLTNETPGTHDIVVTYSGDDTHEPQVADSQVTIPKYNTPISVDVDNCLVGDTAVVTVTLPDDATGNVTIEINAKTYTAEIKDGKAVFNVTGLQAGDKTVAVSYAGDSNYAGNSTTGQFKVSKRPSTVSATGKDINVGKDEVITVIVPKDATGRVLVDINGVGYYGTIVNGKAKVLIPELPSGKYTAKVTYEGDDKYLPSTTTTKFTVTKVKTPIIASGDEIDQGQDATVVVRVPSDATGTVTITVDGKKYTAEVVNGKAVFNIPGLSKGDYKVTASYSGDKKYEANDTVTDIEVYFHDSPSPNGGGEDALGLNKHATGNPILVLLLAILAIGSTQIRRFRK